MATSTNRFNVLHQEIRWLDNATRKGVGWCKARVATSRMPWCLA